MDYMTIQKNITTSPRKLRLVADMVRKMSPDQAVEILSFTNKAAAPLLAKAVKTAIANSGMKETLSFKSIEINEGMKLKRFRSAARGRTRPYKRRFSHIKIVLTDEVMEVKSEKSKVKKIVKREEGQIQVIASK